MTSFAAFLAEMPLKRARALAAQHVFGQPGLALLQHLADADDGRETVLQRGFELAVDGVIGLVEVLAPLGVPDDDVGDANRGQHDD